MNHLLAILTSKSCTAQRVYMNHTLIIYSFLLYGFYEGEVVYEVVDATL